MYLIVGLGNPGAQYAHTRHNVGFDVVDTLARKLGVTIGRERDEALLGECFIAGQKTILALPQTYMNLSCEAVSRPQGAIRIRKNGSAGTHNGMRSIVGLLGYENFPRLRVGVGQRRPGYELADWVLGKFQGEDKKVMDEAVKRAADAVECILKEGADRAMNRFN